MPLPYKQNKQHIYKWVENNRVSFNEYCKVWKKKNYAYNQQAKKLRNILI